MLFVWLYGYGWLVCMLCVIFYGIFLFYWDFLFFLKYIVVLGCMMFVGFLVYFLIVSWKYGWYILLFGIMFFLIDIGLIVL